MKHDDLAEAAKPNLGKASGKTDASIFKRTYSQIQP
jgi:hypothetical protein